MRAITYFLTTLAFTIVACYEGRSALAESKKHPIEKGTFAFIISTTAGHCDLSRELVCGLPTIVKVEEVYGNRVEVEGVDGWFEKDGLISLEDALNYVTELVSKSPNAKSFLLRGRAYELQGKLSDAQVDYEKSLRLDDTEWLTHASLGINLFKQEDWGGCIDALSRALELKPIVDLISLRAICMIESRRYYEALTDLSKAISMAPSAETYSDRGVLYFVRGDVALANADFRRAIELNDRFAYAYYGQGRVQAAWGKHDDAIRLYTKAIELRPDEPMFRQLRGNSKKSIQDNSGAELDWTFARHRHNTAPNWMRPLFSRNSW